MHSETIKTNPIQRSEWRLVLALCLIGLAYQALLLLRLPIQDLLRCDDAFYYFGVAKWFPETGFWTFDGRNATNGVQPGWAILLSAYAWVLSCFHLRDPEGLVRAFWLFSAAFNVLSASVVWYVIRRCCCKTLAVGMLLLLVGEYWVILNRTSGLEIPFYTLVFFAALGYYLLAFFPLPSVRSAVLLGVCLGAAFYGRLTAVWLTPILLGHFLVSGAGTLGRRLRLCVIAGMAALAVVAPYLIANKMWMGHLLPISGAVKAYWQKQCVDQYGGWFSLAYLTFVVQNLGKVVDALARAALIPGLYPLGFAAMPKAAFVVVWGLAAAAVCWRHSLYRNALHLLGRGRSLLICWAGFAVADTLIGTFLYSREILYDGVGWWFTPERLLFLTVTVAAAVVLAKTAAEAILRNRLSPRVIGALPLLVLVISIGRDVHRGRAARVDWDYARNTFEISMYQAAAWMNENLPDGARIGGWNAGIQGFFCRHSLTNLDGLINNYDLLAAIRQERLPEYVQRQQIRYFSDIVDRPDFREPCGNGLLTARSCEELHRAPVIHSGRHIWTVVAALKPAGSINEPTLAADFGPDAALSDRSLSGQ